MFMKRVCVCVCARVRVHVCVSMFNMEKCYRNKIIIIIALVTVSSLAQNIFIQE